MYAATQHHALTYAMYPAAIPQPTTAAQQLDNHHRATLTQPAKRFRRALANAVSGRREPMA
jgi:hypothetical protein